MSAEARAKVGLNWGHRSASLGLPASKIPTSQYPKLSDGRTTFFVQFVGKIGVTPEAPVGNSCQAISWTEFDR